MLPSRAEELREIIGEYAEERNVTLSRLESHRQRRARLEMAREILVQHGDLANADHLLREINEIDQHIAASEELLAKLDHLLAGFRSSLDKIEESAKIR